MFTFIDIKIRIHYLQVIEGVSVFSLICSLRVFVLMKIKLSILLTPLSLKGISLLYSFILGAITCQNKLKNTKKLNLYML